MRKVSILEPVSLLDGVRQHENGNGFGHGNWMTPYRTPAGLAAVAEAQESNFELLLGRRTYDAWAAYWPKAGNNPMAKELNAATKYVATHRPDSLEWGPAEPLGANVAESIRRLKATQGPSLLVWGSSSLTTVLLDQGLVNEVLLLVYPILPGRGKRLFSDSADPRERVPLQLPGCLHGRAAQYAPVCRAATAPGRLAVGLRS